MTPTPDKTGTPSLDERVQMFNSLRLPGQGISMHMGTSYLVNDLWRALTTEREAHEATKRELANLRAEEEACWEVLAEAQSPGTDHMCNSIEDLANRLKAAEAALQAAAEPVAISDDWLRRFWKSQGGEFHGPHVETGCMAEAKLLPMLRELVAAKLAAAPSREQTIEECAQRLEEEAAHFYVLYQKGEGDYMAKLAISNELKEQAIDLRHFMLRALKNDAVPTPEKA